MLDCLNFWKTFSFVFRFNLSSDKPVDLLQHGPRVFTFFFHVEFQFKLICHRVQQHGFE